MLLWLLNVALTQGKVVKICLKQTVLTQTQASH